MEEKKEEKIYYINVDDILPNRFQPRLAFDEKELNDLSNSIIKYGVIQPIVVRRIANKYEIIAGERRYKAACAAGLKEIPAIINDTDDNTSAEIALLENLQRKNLTVIEEANSYKKLLDRGFTQDDIANKLGVSQSSIANKIRLLSLPKEVRDALLYNRISERHARSLLSLDNEDLQKSLLNRIINEKLTVKQTEEEINLLLMKDSKKEEDYFPDNIQRFLNPEEPKPKEIKEEDIEELDFDNMTVPEVVNISNETGAKEVTFEEVKSENESINPYQTDVVESLQDNNLNKNIDINNTKLSSETYKELIEFLNNLSIKNPSVKYNTLELGDKYQILVDIDKY